MKPDSPKKTVKKSVRNPVAALASADAKMSTSAPATPPPAKVKPANRVIARPAAKAGTKTAAKASAAKPAKAPPREKAPPPIPPIPPILLEGDETATPRVSGPGERYALGPEPLAPESTPGPTDLPESYGTQNLFLTARDPQWLYAHWDFSHEQLRRYNARSRDRHLVLRVFRDEAQGDPHREIHVHPESRSWFAQVGQGSTRYVAHLG